MSQLLSPGRNLISSTVGSKMGWYAGYSGNIQEESDPSSFKWKSWNGKFPCEGDRGSVPWKMRSVVWGEGEEWHFGMEGQEERTHGIMKPAGMRRDDLGCHTHDQFLLFKLGTWSHEQLITQALHGRFSSQERFGSSFEGMRPRVSLGSLVNTKSGCISSPPSCHGNSKIRIAFLLASLCLCHCPCLGWELRGTGSSGSN